MSGSLTEAQVAHYRETGHLGPIPALDPDEVAYFLGRLESFEAAEGAPLARIRGHVRAKTYLLFTWMNELVRHPAVLDAVESLIGPDILVYHLTCWPKEPGDGSFVSWHQDATYFFLEPYEQVTAWVALTEATEENGCMRILPGSHRAGQLEHIEGETERNLLANGQTIHQSLPEDEAILVPVPKGNLTLHHTHLVHASGPNLSQGRRIGIGISYIPPHVRFVGEGRQYAMPVRGRDTHGHFLTEVPPKADYDEAARAFHAKVCAHFFARHGFQRDAEKAVPAGGSERQA